LIENNEKMLTCIFSFLKVYFSTLEDQTTTLNSFIYLGLNSFYTFKFSWSSLFMAWLIVGFKVLSIHIHS